MHQFWKVKSADVGQVNYSGFAQIILQREVQAYYVIVISKITIFRGLHVFFNKKPRSRPSTKSFLIFGHILALKKFLNSF